MFPSHVDPVVYISDTLLFQRDQCSVKCRKRMNNFRVKLFFFLAYGSRKTLKKKDKRKERKSNYCKSSSHQHQSLSFSIFTNHSCFHHIRTMIHSTLTLVFTPIFEHFINSHQSQVLIFPLILVLPFTLVSSIVLRFDLHLFYLFD